MSSTLVVQNLKNESAPGNNIALASDGKVGIGTASPAVAMDVVGQVRASTGILFGSDTAAANALDDYEEGTWTPTLTFLTPGNLSVTYSTRVGSYTKIGNFVKVVGVIVTSAFTYTTASGLLLISGLPVSGSTSNGNYFNGSITIGNWNLAGYSYILTNLAPSFQPTSMYIQASGNNVAQSNLETTHVPSGSNLTTRFELSYFAA